MMQYLRRILFGLVIAAVYSAVAVAQTLPDLIVVSIGYDAPTGLFTSVVKNIGAGPVAPPGVTIGVAYSVDGAKVGCGWVTSPLAAGASVTIGAGCGAYTISNGTHTITALADDANLIVESNETNNSLSQQITIGGGGGSINYFVSASGLDTNPGTLALPFKTVNKAASLAVPGTVIQVQAGTYPMGSFSVSGGPSGTAVAHIRSE